MSVHGEVPSWRPEQIRLRPARLLVSLLITAAALGVTAAILPGVDIADAVGRWSSRSSSAC